MDCFELFQATVMVLTNHPTSRVDGLFFHAQPFGDEEYVFDIAAQLVHDELAGTVVLNGSDGRRPGGSVRGEAWLGWEAYADRLRSRRVSSCLLTQPAFNTREENNNFLAVARDCGWRSAAILTQAPHALRCLLGMIAVMKETHYPMQIYSIVPGQTIWGQHVSDSQGLETMLRVDHLRTEFERIERYQKKGDLASLSDLVRYLRFDRRLH